MHQTDGRYIMNDEQFSNSLKDEIYGDLGINHEDYLCKMSNIKAFLHINRKGLQNGKIEKRLLMYRSLAGESIFIEYPGKESTAAYAGLEEKNILNPNDFRPELHTADGEILAKLSFIDIIEALVEYAWLHDKETMQKIAALIIKLAYMKGYKYKALMHPSNLIVVHDKKHREVMGEREEDVIERYFLPMSIETKEYLSGWDKINLPSRKYQKKVQVSIEGFLYYLDILAQQEDCKYYYTRRIKGEKSLKVGVGRINNLLTVVNVIDRLLSDRPYGDIVSSIGKYVRPIDSSKIEYVTGGLIEVIEDTNSIVEIEIG